MALVLSTPIPPDIINEVFNYLHNDKTTLKKCSLISRLFYESTRKHIFASITLDRPDVVASLNRALMQNPGLSVHIHTLELPFLTEGVVQKIIPLLPALSQTRHLVLGPKFYLRMQVPAPEELSLLSVVLRLPHLNSLEILAIRGIPASYLHIAQGLKSLTIKDARVFRIDVVEAVVLPLPHLQSLYLHRVWTLDRVPNFNPILKAPNLCQITIAIPKSSIQPIILTGAQSIETVIWIDYIQGQDYSMIDLGVLQNLRQLRFVLHGGDPSARPTWDPISRILRSGVVAQTLEEISFAIKQGIGDVVVVPILTYVGLGDIWTNLVDGRQFPKLKKVRVYLVNEGDGGPNLGADAFRLFISQKLPLLEEAGLLHTMVYDHLEWYDFL